MEVKPMKPPKGFVHDIVDRLIAVRRAVVVGLGLGGCTAVVGVGLGVEVEAWSSTLMLDDQRQ